MGDISKLLKDYLDYLEIEKNRLPRTRENYEHYLKTFFRRANITRLKDLTLESVRAFRLALARQNLKKTTQSYYVIAIRNFLKYLIKQDYDVPSPDKIELPKLTQRQIDILEYAELERLLRAPTGNDLRSLRDKAILETMFSTGLRLSELCQLSRYLDFGRGELTVRGKGEKLRTVFLSPASQSALRRYLEKRTDAEERLFVSLDKNKEKPRVVGPITARSVQRLIDFHARKAGITRHVHPHIIRHVFATDLLMNGADLRSVQEMLGHSSVATTQIYTHVTNKHLQEVHKAFHGRRRN